jgi:prepilin-type N-terminal cleavage/methylation domain-containing protein
LGVVLMKKKPILIKGFTLIELILAIAILAILTSISILSYTKLATQSQDSVDLNTARKIERSIYIYISESNDKNLSELAHSNSTELISNLQGEISISPNSENDKVGIYGPYLEKDISIVPQGEYTGWKITITGSLPDISVLPDNSNSVSITN